jgi:SAM-dependent methyltransferase
MITVGLAITIALALSGPSTCVGGDQEKRSSGDPTANDAGDQGSQAKKADGQLPPIECPLHKAGINPHDLKPFEEVEKYIAFLERADRQLWQKPDEVVTALGLRGKETIVDLGAGSGYFSFRFAKALPQGKVVAVDTQPEMVRHIHHKVMSEGIPNVEARLADPNDPKLPTGADVVFLCDVLHHVQQRPQWLKMLHTQMSSGARLVLIEFKAGKLPEGPPEAVKIPKDKLIALVREAGFRLQRDTPGLLPYQEFLTFVKP